MSFQKYIESDEISNHLRYLTKFNASLLNLIRGKTISVFYQHFIKNCFITINKKKTCSMIRTISEISTMEVNITSTSSYNARTRRAGAQSRRGWRHAIAENSNVDLQTEAFHGDIRKNTSLRVYLREWRDHCPILASLKIRWRNRTRVTLQQFREFLQNCLNPASKSKKTKQALSAEEDHGSFKCPLW